MFRAIHSDEHNLFSVRLTLTGVQHTCFVPHVLAKLDTGAMGTVISLGALLKPEYLSALGRVKFDLDNKGAVRLKSASGGDMIGFPYYLKNVKVSGVLLPKFYFYLVPDGEREIVLLGYDFISCLDFCHSPGGDIIGSMNIKMYEDRHAKGYLAINSVESLVLASVDKARMTASACRWLYGVVRDESL